VDKGHLQTSEQYGSKAHFMAKQQVEDVLKDGEPQMTLSMKNTIFFRVANQRSGIAFTISSRTGLKNSDWFSEKIDPVNWNRPRQANAATIPHSTCKKRFLMLMSEKWSIL